MIVKNPTYVKVEVPAPSKFTQWVNKSLKSLTKEDLLEVTSFIDSMFSEQKELISVEMPDTITSLSNKLFRGCSSLEKVKLSKALKSIPLEAFAYCTNLTKIELPEGVTSIGGGLWNQGAFDSCTNLSVLVLPTTLNEIIQGTFSRTPTKNVYIKDIGAFSKIMCGASQVADVGGGALSPYRLYLNDVQVENLELPEDIYTIGKNIYNGILGLKTANLKNVSIINDYAFNGCKTLVTVTIGTNLTKINDNVFNNCITLSSITIDKPCITASDVPVLVNTNAIPSTAYIYVPDTATQTLYKSATNWSTIADRILVKEA